MTERYVACQRNLKNLNLRGFFFAEAMSEAYRRNCPWYLLLSRTLLELGVARVTKEEWDEKKVRRDAVSKPINEEAGSLIIALDFVAITKRFGVERLKIF